MAAGRNVSRRPVVPASAIHFPVLLVLFACAKHPPGGDTATRGDTGDAQPDTAADTSVDTADTAADTGHTGTVDPGPCGPWTGVLRVGTTWTYTPSDAYVALYGMDGTFTTTVLALTDEHVTLSTEGRYDGASSYFHFVRTDTWLCDGDGAWWTASSAQSDGVSGSSVIAQEGWRSFEPGWLVRPWNLEVGTTWNDSFTATSSVNGSEPEAVAASCVSTVVGEGNRVVGAGTFPALQVDYACSGVSLDDAWLAEGTGLLETEDETLERYLP